MFSFLKLKSKRFIFSLITVLLFSQSEINKAYSEVIDNKKLFDIEYLEKSDSNFYILGEGDQLKITILDMIEDLSEIEAIIDPQGMIILPEIGRVYVSGLTLDELEFLLNKKFSKIIKDPDIEIGVLKPKPLKISIRGEVKNPGMYTFFYGNPRRISEKDPSASLGFTPTLFDAIQKAGGITPYSDLTKIEVIRNNPMSDGGGQIKTGNNTNKDW